MRRIRPPALLRRLLLAILMIGAWGLCLSSAAFAHAGLVATQPEDGAILASEPERFELTFSEAISPLRLVLVSPDGSSRDLKGVEVSGQRMTASAPAGLTRGTYVLSWRVVSADGHPVAGSFPFSLGVPSAMPDLPSESDGAVQTLVWGSRVLIYVGLVFGVGGVAAGYLVGAASSRTRRILRGLLAAGLFALPAAVAAQGLDALGAPLRALARTAVWQAGASTSFGPAALALALSFGAALAATIFRPRALSILLAAAALVLAGMGLAATGHAANAPPHMLTRPAVALHALSAALWLGALLPLGCALQRSAADQRLALQRFSGRIAPILAILLITGALLAAIQVGTPSALWQTAYGRVLLLKLGLLALLFLVASDNRWRLTRPALKGDAPALRSLKRRIGFEIALAVMVLSTVALWRFTPPPRVEIAIAAEPVLAHGTGRQLMADVTVNPGHAGPVEIRAMLMTIDYGPVDARSVRFVFSRAGDAAPPLSIQATKPGDGTWRSSATLPSGGVWRLRIDVEIDETTSDRIESDIRLRP